jgi:hypothetical protein
MSTGHEGQQGKPGTPGGAGGPGGVGGVGGEPSGTGGAGGTGGRGGDTGVDGAVVHRKGPVWTVRIAGVLLFIAGMVGVVMSARTSSELHRTQDQLESYVSCKAKYDDMVNARTRVLTVANEAERVSERGADDALTALIAHPASFIPREDRTPQEQAEIAKLSVLLRQALLEQQTQRNKADDTREANPVPPPPTEVCK